MKSFKRNRRDNRKMTEESIYRRFSSSKVYKWPLKTFLAASILCSSSLASANSQICIPSQGYQPPQYTAQQLLGTLAGIRPLQILVGQGDISFMFTGPWTDWYRQDLESALAELAVIRGLLDARNLKHLYSGLTGNISPEEAIGMCPAENDPQRYVRTVDGSCNKIADPLAGKVGTRFGRNVSVLSIIQPETGTLYTPNPREVSTKLLRRDNPGNKVPFLNLWANAWIQFMIHDWFDHGPSDRRRPLSIPIASNDPISMATGQQAITTGSTPADPLPKEAGLPVAFNNYVTHWWDGSQLYGSDQATADRLRSFQGGKLLLDQQGRLPINDKQFGDAGFTSNWWLGLEMLHTLFVKEHNAIADMLAAAHPEMSDQELYDKARLINAALMAKIHTVEWTPAILPNKTLDVGMNANWYGLQRFVPDPVEKVKLGQFVLGAIANGTFTAKTINPIIYGIMGGETDDKGVSFSMTEEFVAIYRMHQLLPDFIGILDGDGKLQEIYDSLDLTNAGARAVFDKVKFRDLAMSFGLQKPGTLTLKNYPRFLTELEIFPGNKIDLAAIDILRDRERGLPRYNTFRQLLNLPRVPSIEALTDDPDLRAKLNEVYPGGINTVDLFVGTLAESQRPTCYGFGETLFQTFILMASRRLQADRFYTVDYRPQVYTQEGLNWIANNSFKTVLQRHIPEIAKKLQNVENAFKPWQDTPTGKDSYINLEQSEKKMDADIKKMFNSKYGL